MHGRVRRTAFLTVAALTMAGVLIGAPSATAVDTQMTIDRTVIDFGSVNVGTTSPPISVTLTNSGTTAFGPINIFGGAPPTPDYNASQNCQGTTLAAGASCTVNYTFTPSVAGLKTDTSAFTISKTSSQSDGEDFSVSLRGTGTSTTTTTTATTTTTKPPTTTTGSTGATRPVTTTTSGPSTTAPPAGKAQATVAHTDVVVGQDQSAIGRGFQPGELVSAVEQPDGLDLGSRVADSEGVVRFSWTISKTDRPGTHEFVATGAKSGMVSATFTVAENKDDSGISPLLIAVIAVIALLAIAAVVYFTYRRSRGSGHDSRTAS
jgi:hypothetical protein